MKFLWIFLFLSVAAFGQITPGSQQTYTNSTIQFQAKPWYDIRDYAGSPDACVQANNAIAALPSTGGTIMFPGGSFTCSTTINLNKNNVNLRGQGAGSPPVAITGATTLNFNAGITGIDITGSKSSVQDLFLHSASSGSGTDDGIRVRAGSVTLRRLGIHHFGRQGVRVDGGNSGGSADLWHFEDVESANNFGDGFHWATPCTDNHLGTGIQLNAFVNGGWGYNLQCGSANHFVTVHATQNTLGAFNVASSWNVFDNAYIESGTGSSFVIPPGVIGVKVYFQQFGQPTTITNAGGTALGNSIYYFGDTGFPVFNALLVGGQPYVGTNKTYAFQVGGTSGSALSFFNLTDSQTMGEFDPVNKWTFFQKVTTTSTAGTPGFNLTPFAGDPSTPTNGDMWYNSTLGKFRCYEAGTASNCVGGGGGGSGTVTHTAGALTSGNVVIGNTGADIKVDTGCTTDGAGTETCSVALNSPTHTASGSDGGLDGTEGTGLGLTAAASHDLFWPDSAAHRWKMNNNNGGAQNVLGANDWAVPGTIGSTTPNTGSFTTVTTTNANGGFSGTEGTGAGVPPAGGLDVMWPDSTAHRWIMNNNNTGNQNVLGTFDFQAVYNHSGTQQTTPHIVQDSCTLGTDCAVTLTSSAVYTNSTSYTCACVDATAINACRVNQTSGSAFTITGTGTDVIRYLCAGN